MFKENSILRAFVEPHEKSYPDCNSSKPIVLKIWSPFTGIQEMTVAMNQLETFSCGVQPRSVSSSWSKQRCNVTPCVTQTMNHCVTNHLYQDGNNFIAHHRNTYLDLHQEGVIVSVSVSLGDERIMELKCRLQPKDVIHIHLPHRSMPCWCWAQKGINNSVI
jgi:hypothetical protein